MPWPTSLCDLVHRSKCCDLLKSVNQIRCPWEHALIVNFFLSLEMVADWDALQNSFLEQVTKLAELAVADEALEKRIAAARIVRQV